MERFDLYLSHEDRFDLFFSYEDKFSIRVDNLISVLYMNGVPSGFVIHSSTACADMEVFVSIDVENMMISSSKGSADIYHKLRVEDKMAIEASVARGLLYIVAKAAHPDVLSMDAYPATLSTTIDISASSVSMSIDDNVVADAIKTIIHARSSLRAQITSAVADICSIGYADARESRARLIWRADLSVGDEIRCTPVTIRMRSNSASASVYAPYYVAMWADYILSDLRDMTLLSMTRGEVTE